MRTRRFALLAAGAATALGFFLYGPTFSSAYAYDDVDYLNQAADVLSGRAPFWPVLFRPQGEHFVPVLRLLMTASASLFGTNATPLRLLVFAAHVLSALFLALTARRLLKDDVAGLTTGILYVLPCGFSSMWLWFPSGGCVPIGIAGVTGSIAAIAHADTLGRRRAAWLAAAGCAFALACDNSLVPLLSAPFLVSLVERRRTGDRRLVSGLEAFLAALAAAALLLTRLFYARFTGMELHTEPVAALKRFVFLSCVAPFRYLFPGPSVLRPLGLVEWFPKMETAFGIVIALAVAAALLVLLTRATRRSAVAALATLPAGLGFLALVGIARWNYPYAELFDGDRYFFPLLIPAALLAGTAVAAFRERLLDRRLRAALLGLALVTIGLETLLHRRAMLYRVSWNVYAAHANRFATLTRLAEMLADAARTLPPDAPPLAVPDAGLHFPDIHNGTISTRFLLTISNRRPTPRLVLARGPVGPRDAGLLNDVFAAWAREAGEAPWFSVEGGGIRDLRRRGTVDFVASGQDPDVVSGFFSWENPGRWMSSHGVLRATMSGRMLRLEFDCPEAALAAAGAALPSLEVSVEDESGGGRAGLGAVATGGAGWRVRELAVPEAAWDRLGGRPVRIVLEARPTWRPTDVLRGSGDDRDLSIRLLRLSFSGE